MTFAQTLVGVICGTLPERSGYLHRRGANKDFSPYSHPDSQAYKQWFECILYALCNNSAMHLTLVKGCASCNCSFPIVPRNKEIIKIK